MARQDRTPDGPARTPTKPKEGTALSRVVEIAAARLPSGGDLLIVLAEPDDGPATVRIHWPAGNPTTIDPAQFRDAAATVVKLFGDAHVTLTRIRSRRLR